MKYLTYSFFSLIPLLSFFFIQIPTEVPKPNNNDPIDLSNTADVIIYIVLPVVLLILFFIGRRYRKKK